jgi:hypothetical protein
LSLLFDLGDVNFRENGLCIAAAAVDAELLLRVLDEPFVVEGLVDEGVLRVACNMRVSKHIYASVCVRTRCWFGWFFEFVVGGAGRWRSRDVADLLGPSAPPTLGQWSGIRPSLRWLGVGLGACRFGVGLRRCRPFRVVVGVLRVLGVGSSCAVDLPATVAFLSDSFRAVEGLDCRKIKLVPTRRKEQEITYSTARHAQSSDACAFPNGIRRLATHLAACRKVRAQARHPANRTNC